MVRTGRMGIPLAFDFAQAERRGESGPISLLTPAEAGAQLPCGRKDGMNLPPPLCLARHRPGGAWAPAFAGVIGMSEFR